MEKFPKLLENHKGFSCDNVIRKDERDALKKEKIWQSAAKPREIISYLMGKVQRL